MKIMLSILLFPFVFLACGQTEAVNFEKIQNFHNQGKFKEAIDLSTNELKKIKNSDSLYKKIIVIRVDCFMGLSDFKSAIDDWKILIGLNPKDVSNYEGVAYAYWAIGDDANCFEYLHNAHKINPQNASLLSNMSYYYGEIGKYDESIKYSTIGLDQSNLEDKLKGSLLNNRGHAYIGLMQYDKAIKDINQSMNYFPENSYAYYYRALANIGLKQMNTVCSDLQKAKSLGGVVLTKELIVKHCEK